MESAKISNPKILNFYSLAEPIIIFEIYTVIEDCTDKAIFALMIYINEIWNKIDEEFYI